jgi:anhydro-N-acetylmuramic acid kinase
MGTIPVKIYKTIGLMSGTSLDGIDAALIETDGVNFIRRLGFLTVPYRDELRAQLRACFNLPPEPSALVDDAETALTLAHAAVVQTMVDTYGAVDLIGFHGQTIAHNPALGYTCQIGDGALLASLAKTPVVNDFRTADVVAGGQGAPLVPVYHQALAASLEKPVVFLNIGGVANVTYIGADGELIAFDTGAGNALIDDWMLTKTGQKFDENGNTARRGTVNDAVLNQLLSHEFFSAPVPKSLDRNAFVSPLWEGLTLEDGAATLAMFTVEAIVKACEFFPVKAQQLIVAGGGRHNRFIMEKLREKLQTSVISIDTIGLNGDAIEAEAFAYLAVRSLKKLPLSFPTTTGVSAPLTGGRYHP